MPFIGTTGGNAKFIVPFVLLGIIIITGLLFLASNTPQTPTPSPSPTPTPAPTETSKPAGEAPPVVTQTIRAEEIPNAHAAYQFRATIPAEWRVEAVAETDALNIYDPAASGETNLEKSQIFIRYFTASTFLTLQTVTIHEQTALTVGGRPAVRYDIEKKAGIADFANQPSWRSQRHIVTDIRVSDNNPSTFYVIAANPTLDMPAYEAFLTSLIVNQDTAGTLVEPVDELVERITKKPFGLYVSPENSPVDPEVFTGYHTAIDVEYADVAADVPVRAAADGEVLVARTAQGYGGVVAIQHTIASQPVIGIYGHLDPGQLPAIGSTVSAGQSIGILGDGYTEETDNERKHLHFGLVRGSTVNLLGYVQSSPELADWHDPIKFFE